MERKQISSFWTNHSASNLISYIKEEAEKVFEGSNILGRLLVPDKFAPGEESTFGPFRFETLAIGLIRSVNRQGHLTMKHGQVHSLLSFIGCVQNHLSDDFSSKFPVEEYKRVRVDYYNFEKIEALAKDTDSESSYHKLEKLLRSLVNKSSSVKDAAEAVITNVKQIASANEFVDFNDVYGQRVIQQLLN